jgi:two-component system, cell cycle sensor histidine kinase and response regulator CckA
MSRLNVFNRPDRRRSKGLAAAGSIWVPAVIVLVLAVIANRCAALPGSAFVIGCASLGLLFVRPNGAFSRVLTAPALKGRILPPVLLAGLLAPIATEGLTVLGSRLGLYGENMRDTLHVLTTMALLSVMAMPVSMFLAESEAARDAALEKVRQGRDQYQKLIDSTPNLVFCMDGEDRHIAVNAALCQMLNRSPEEIIGKSAAELGFPPEVARRWHQDNERVRTTGQPISTESVVLFPDGRLHALRTVVSPLRDESDEVVAVEGLSVDVTDEKEAQASTQKLLRGVEQMDEVMFTTDPEGVITYINPAFERVYGFQREEALGRTPRILKSGTVPKADYERFWAEILAGRIARAEYSNRRKDGQFVRVVSSVTPVTDDCGKLIGFIAVQQDVTEQRRSEAERRNLEKQIVHLGKMEALGTLAGGIAHDFNNILSIILSYASVLDRSRGDDPRFAAGLGTIRQAVQRGAALSRQVLTFARKGEAKPEPTRVNTIVTELAAMIRETFPKNLRLSTDLAPELGLISIDPGQLHQAILNLCVNARDAMPGGGSLEISTRSVSAAAIRDDIPDAPAKDFVVLSVRDSGIGMDEETRRRLFEPFFTTKEKGKGTGLGLAVVYGIVKSCDGYVDVRSQPGQGTTFRLFFPQLPEAGRFSSSSVCNAALGGSETVLIVEDEAPILDFLVASLADRGYKVESASDGRAAIDILRRSSGRVQVIVTDLGLPGISGSDLVAAFREISPNAPIVAMTGSHDPDLSARLASTRVRVLQKPFAEEALLQVVRATLDARVPEAESRIVAV